MIRDDQPPGGRWRWRPRQESLEPDRLLLYEPGNWGDILKGSWAVAVVEGLVERRADAGSIRILDPFAGAPDYPLSDASRARAQGLPSSSALAQRLRPYLEGGRWPSSALLARDAATARGATAALLLHDHDPRHRQAWARALPPSSSLIAPAAGAEDVHEATLAGDERIDLVLIDPYDLLHRWGRWIPRIARALPETPHLLYLYNKSPRGEGHEDQYRRFRRGLERAIPEGCRWLLGRLASDARAPRAHHEAVFLGDADLVGSLREGLHRETEEIARSQGCDTPFALLEE